MDEIAELRDAMSRRNGAIFLHSGAGFVDEHRRNAARWDLAALVRELHDRVAARPNIKAYLESDRRIPFNESGIFRHYKELDG